MVVNLDWNLVVSFNRNRWSIYAGIRWSISPFFPNYEIITYENEENSYINDRLLEIEERIGKYHLKTVVGGKTLYSIYLTKEEAKNMYDNGIEFIKIINEKGQIYI